jgi:hypothetical protein
VDCADIPNGAPDLVITNGLSGNCLIESLIVPTQQGVANLCGGTVSYTWTFTDVCNRTTTHVQNITANPVPQAQYVNAPPSATVDCADIPNGAPDLVITNGLSGNCLIESLIVPTQQGFANLCGGTVSYTWTFTDVCNRTTTHVQTINAIPVPQGQFIGAPFDLSINCGDDPGVPTSLPFTNGLSGACLIEELVPVNTSNNAGVCGGQIVNTWTYTDVCGRTSNHIQTITVNPTPIPTFDDYPPNITLECTEIPSTYPSLIYDNGMNNACRIAGVVLPQVTGNAGLCGGLVTNTWTFTDVCGRTINHSRTVTVNPAPAAEFLSLPPDITLECFESVSAPQNLAYTNGLGGQCGIQGEAIPNVVGDPDICGGQITYIWSYTDGCNRNINHSQFITINPATEAALSTHRQTSWLPVTQRISCRRHLIIPMESHPMNVVSQVRCRVCAQVVMTTAEAYCISTGNLRMSVAGK